MQRAMLTLSTVLLAFAAMCGLATAAPLSSYAAGPITASPSDRLVPAALRPVLERSLDIDSVTGAWLEQRVVAGDGAQTDQFGYAVAVSGTTALVGSKYAVINGHGQEGAVYVFTESNGIWSFTQKLTAVDGTNTRWFGHSIAFDGTTALICAPGTTVDGINVAGEVYVFTFSGGAWTQTQELTSEDGEANGVFGNTVTMDGGTAFVGSSNATIDGVAGQGAAYVFTNSGGTWNQTQKLVSDDGGTGDSFAQSIGLSGTTAVIASPVSNVNGNFAAGAAYVFNESGGVWDQSQKLTIAGGAVFDLFATTVVLQGTTALISDQSAVDGNAQQGAVYVFTESGGTWTQAQKLVSDDGLPTDEFGWSMVLDGSRAFIGTPQNIPNSSATGNPGKVYLFTQSAGIWSQADIISPSDAQADELFGVSVAFDDAFLLSGALGNNTYQGAAYFYTAPSSPPVANITPRSLSFTVIAGATGSDTLTISNSGDADLTFTLGEAVADCSNPTDVSWLSETPVSGSVAGGASQDVTVTADATGLDPGDYSALLCVTTNDPNNGLIQIPVSLAVGPDDTIFKDGFDGTP